MESLHAAFVYIFGHNNIGPVSIITAVLIYALICVFVKEAVVAKEVVIVVLGTIANIALIVIIFIYCSLKAFKFIGIFCSARKILTGFTLRRVNKLC